MKTRHDIAVISLGKIGKAEGWVRSTGCCRWSSLDRQDLGLLGMQLMGGTLMGGTVFVSSHDGHANVAQLWSYLNKTRGVTFFGGTVFPFAAYACERSCMIRSTIISSIPRDAWHRQSSLKDAERNLCEPSMHCLK